jgi:RNA polymerase sigma-70 factor, ECF subfamily
MTDSPASPQTMGVWSPLAEPRHAPGPDLDQVFAAHAGYVGLSLRRLGIPERDLEDVVHDVFLVVHRHLHDYDPARPILPWLFGIAVRVSLAYRRRAGFQREDIRADVHATDPGPTPDERVDGERSRRLVLAALEKLGHERRAVLVMHDIDGHSMTDIARALHVPLNTGYSRLRLARADFVRAVKSLSSGGAP